MLVQTKVYAAFDPQALNTIEVPQQHFERFFVASAKTPTDPSHVGIVTFSTVEQMGDFIIFLNTDRETFV